MLRVWRMMASMNTGNLRTAARSSTGGAPAFASLPVAPRLATALLNRQLQNQAVGSGQRLVSTEAVEPAAPAEAEASVPFQQVSVEKFNKQLVHTVQLVGKLTWDVELKQITSRNAQNFTVGQVNVDVFQFPDAGPNSKARMSLEFWNEKAQAAAAQLKRGDWVEVRGTLGQDRWADRQTQQPRMRMKVGVTQFNKIADVPAGLDQPQPQLQ